VPAGKVVDPVRTIPRATLVGTVFTGAIYLVVCSAVVLLMPTDSLKASNAPLSDFVGLYWGGDAGKVLALFAAISAFGALNGWVLLQGEMPYAMAKGGVFPAFLAKESARGAPVRAHLLSAGFLTILVLMNYAKSMADLFTFIALVATTASLFAYLACALAALKLQATRRIAPTTALTVVAIWRGSIRSGPWYGAGGQATAGHGAPSTADAAGLPDLTFLIIPAKAVPSSLDSGGPNERRLSPLAGDRGSPLIRHRRSGAAVLARSPPITAPLYVHAGKLVDTLAGKVLTDQLITHRGRADRLGRAVEDRPHRRPGHRLVQAAWSCPA
jgi:hypothetical protein